MKRILSMFLAAVIVITLIPMAVFAETTSALETDLEGKKLLVGRAVEFTVTSAAATEDLGKMVKCHYEIDAEESDIEKLEYYETATGIEGWYEFPSKLSGSFGPATGFPYMNEATSRFRVTFAKAGEYAVTLSADLVDETGTICTKSVDVTVDNPVASEMTTDISEKEFIVGNSVEFSVTTVPNDDADIFVKGTYEINANEDDIAKLEYYETYAGMEGWYELPSKLSGTFGPATGFPMTSATSRFRVTFANAGDYSVELSAVTVESGAVLCGKNVEIEVLDYADYSALNAAIKTAQECVDNEDKYAKATIADLKTALNSAKEVVDARYTEKDQTAVDAALAELTTAVENLKKLVAVSVSATAVASDVAAEYGKADTIVLVFGTALGCDAADVLDAISISDDVASAEWVDTYKTVLKLNLVDGYTLTNDAEIAFEESEAVVDTNGNVVSEMTVAVVGNLEDVSEEITANAMTATIVKGSSKPGVNADDKIVLVFNAPVKNTPAEIDVTSDASSAVMKAAKDDTMATVYVISNIDADIVDSSKLTVGEISDVNLLGSFGTAVAPVVTKVLAVEKSNNALAENDEIVIYFSRPTNGVTITSSKIQEILGIADATADWGENNTVLTITLGNESVVSNNMTINLDGLGIMDEYDLADYAALDLTLEGAFITSEAPIVERILIVDNNGTAKTEDDNIIISFNVPTNGVELTTDNVAKIIAKAGQGLGTDFEAVWNDAKTEITITVGKTATLDDTVLFNLKDLGIKDKDELHNYVGVVVAPEGSFGTSIAPKITRAIAFTQGTKHIIRVFFNTEVEVKGAMSVTIDNGFDEGTHFSEKWTDNGITYYDLILGDDHSEFVTGVNTITFNGVVADKETGKTSENVSAIINGGFEQDIEPEILSLTAYSNDGSGVAKAGDKIVLVLNSKVTKLISDYDFVTVDNVIYTHTLISNDEVLIGDEIKFEIEAQGKNYTKKATVAGSYGYKAEPKLLSATAYSKDGSGIAKAGDEIILTFNAPVSGVASTLGTVTTTDNMTFVIALAADDSVSVGDELTFDVTSIATGERYNFKVNLAGSFGEEIEPKLISVTAYSKDGSGVAKVGDSIVVVFNTPVSDVETTLGDVTTNDNVIWTITLTDDNVAIGDSIEFDVYSIATNKAYNLSSTIKGSFGYKAEAKLLSATVYSADGSGIAKAGDKIVLVFNMPVEGVRSALGNASTTDKSVWTITLAADNSVKIGDELKFNDVTDVATGTTYRFETYLAGNLGLVVEPELISATAYSKDGSGVAKVGDEIVLVFNAPVDGVTSMYGDATTTDKTVWTISIENTNIRIGETLSFNVKSIANGTTKNCSAALEGSFGRIVEPKSLSINAISNDGSGVAKAGDKIVVVFNTSVTVKKINNVAVTEGTGNVYTYTLKADNEFNVGDEFILTVVSVDNGKEYTLNTADNKTTVDGSFGYSEMPTVKSAVLSENNGIETIAVVFDRATNKVSIDTSILYDNNNHLGMSVLAVWESDTVLKITLASNATTTDASKLNLSDLGIKAQDTGAVITGIDELAITGTLIPVVQSVNASGKVITITFSTRTNGVANISNLVTLLGAGAKAEWSENNKVLTIALGENYTITNNGYIVLNGMGIKDAFSGTNHVVGQYKVSGSIETDTLAVTKVVAQSTEKSKVEAQKGDTIVVKFNSATNLNGAELNPQNPKGADVDAIISVDGGNEAAFGTGYTGMWTAYDTFVIILGGKTTVKNEETDLDEEIGNDPAIAVGTEITVSGVAFANGEGTMETTALDLGGSFNGREFVITEGAITRTGANNTGDYRVEIKVEDTLLNPNIVPTIVCVAYSGTSPVSVMRICVDVENTIQPVFEFAESLKLTSAKIYVFNELFGDANSNPSVLAETLEVK